MVMCQVGCFRVIMVRCLFALYRVGNEARWRVWISPHFRRVFDGHKAGIYNRLSYVYPFRVHNSYKSRNVGFLDVPVVSSHKFRTYAFRYSLIASAKGNAWESVTVEPNALTAFHSFRIAWRLTRPGLSVLPCRVRLTSRERIFRSSILKNMQALCQLLTLMNWQYLPILTLF